MSDVIKLEVKMTQDEAISLYAVLSGVQNDLSIRELDDLVAAETLDGLDRKLQVATKGLNRLMNELELYMEI